jgi:hypothetical protein
MKYFILAAALSVASPGLLLAQTSAPSTNPSAHSQPSTSPNGPAGAGMMEQGKTRPCSSTASGTSDRGGGTEGASTASSGPNNNPNGKVASGC